MDSAVFRDIKEKLKALFNLNVVHVQEILAGSNNKLFRVKTDEEPLLAKIYLQDDRQRLQREFQAISFFNKLNIAHTPKAFLKSDSLQYAVYSYEIANTKVGNVLTKNDIELMALFIATLHNIEPEQVKEEFLPAMLACFSLQDYINNSRYRLKRFNDYIVSETVIPQILQFTLKQNLNEIIESLITKTIAYIPKEEVTQSLPITLRRLSPMDFGPHNMLFKANGDITFVDFEYFGWDDPARLIADFTHHDQTNDISLENKQLFLTVYRKNVKLPKKVLDRIDMITKLTEIEWLTIILYSLTPEKINARQFADNHFNIDNYIEKQINKFNNRLQRIEANC